MSLQNVGKTWLCCLKRFLPDKHADKPIMEKVVGLCFPRGRAVFILWIGTCEIMALIVNETNSWEFKATMTQKQYVQTGNCCKKLKETTTLNLLLYTVSCLMFSICVCEHRKNYYPPTHRKKKSDIHGFGMKNTDFKVWELTFLQALARSSWKDYKRNIILSDITVLENCI